MGSLLGLALGDALGAPFEGGPLERAIWRCIGKTADGRRRWTDDTQMALDVAESLSLSSPRPFDPDDLARRFAQSYRWSRGYGPGTARTLRLIRRGVAWHVANRAAFSEGSLGNGAAMRAPVVGLFCARSQSSLAPLARACARITHAHPLAEEGAVLVARATALALSDATPVQILGALQAKSELPEFGRRLAVAAAWLRPAALRPSEAVLPSPADVRARLGSGVAATDSVVTAVYVALRFLSSAFDELIAFVAACGGDVDTIGAMAGAIWGARNGDGALPAAALARLEQSERIRQTAHALYAAEQRGPDPESNVP